MEDWRHALRFASHREVRSVDFTLYCVYLWNMDQENSSSMSPALLKELKDYCKDYSNRRNLPEPCSCSSCRIGKDWFPSCAFPHFFHVAKSLGPKAILSFIILCAEEIGQGPKFLKFLLSSDVSTTDLIIILGGFSFLRFDGWGIRNLPGLMNSFECRDSDAYIRTILLIMYGFPYMFDKDYFRNRFEKLKKVKVGWTSLGNQISNHILDSGSLRLQMALDILMVLFGDILQLKHIMSIIWRTVPFPYITSKEMFALLTPFYRGKYITLKKVCKEYRKKNPLFEVPEVPQPRSLKHLSRVQVRKSMCDACSIGNEAIESLNIPSVFKDYLKLLE